MSFERRRLNLTFSVAILGVTIGCANPGAAGPNDATAVAGTITAISGNPIEVTVEEVPGATGGGDKAVARIDRRTRIIVSGKSATPDALRVGQYARVWFRGPVMLSYPARGNAARIIVESPRPTAR